VVVLIAWEGYIRIIEAWKKFQKLRRIFYENFEKSVYDRKYSKNREFDVK